MSDGKIDMPLGEYCLFENTVQYSSYECAKMMFLHWAPEGAVESVEEEQVAESPVEEAM